MATHSTQTSAETTKLLSVALGLAVLWLLSYGHLRLIPVACFDSVFVCACDSVYAECAKVFVFRLVTSQVHNIPKHIYISIAVMC